MQGSWENKLLERIHNVNSGNRKWQISMNTDHQTPVAKRGRRKVASKVTRYPPIRDSGDDEITMQRNMDRLHKEVAKKKPKKELSSPSHARRFIRAISICPI